MSYSAERARKKAEQREINAATSKQRRDEHLLTISNDTTNADELLPVVRYGFLSLFFIWVGYVGYVYLSKELVGAVEAWQASVLAVALPLAFQSIKVYCATKCLRAFHFKWYDESAQDLWLWRLMGALTVLAFAWTLKISVWDVKSTATGDYIKQNTASLDAHLKAATADIDAQISALETKEKQNGSLRTKSGKINWAVQPLAAENAKSASSLAAQRERIVNAATEEFKSMGQRVEVQAKSRGNFFQRFGGFGEIGEIICLLIVGLLEARLRNANATPTATQRTAPPYQPAHSLNGNGQPHPTVNEAPQRYYFTRDEPTGNVLPSDDLSRQPLFAPENAVSQSPPTVTQQNDPGPTNHADAVLKLAEKELRGFAANFDRRQGHNSTVSANINRILNQTARTVRGRGFQPTRPVWLKFYYYITGELFPALNEKGWPYEYESQFVADVYRLCPEPATEAT